MRGGRWHSSATSACRQQPPAWTSSMALHSTQGTTEGSSPPPTGTERPDCVGQDQQCRAGLPWCCATSAAAAARAAAPSRLGRLQGSEKAQQQQHANVSDWLGGGSLCAPQTRTSSASLAALDDGNRCRALLPLLPTFLVRPAHQHAPRVWVGKGLVLQHVQQPPHVGQAMGGALGERRPRHAPPAWGSSRVHSVLTGAPAGRKQQSGGHLGAAASLAGKKLSPHHQMPIAGCP